MSRGFTFCGTHSSVFGIIFLSTNRRMLPARRRSTIIIPGRDGYRYTGISTYDERAITVTCSFLAEHVDDIPARARLVAAWLSGRGSLAFDDEPGKYYVAEVVDGIDLERAYRVVSFPVTFVCEPFAYSLAQQVTKSLSEARDECTVPVGGTAETPCRITIRNDGQTDIVGIKLSRRKEE